jgi:hypothetical protein
MATHKNDKAKEEHQAESAHRPTPPHAPPDPMRRPTRTMGSLNPTPSPASQRQGPSRRSRSQRLSPQ